MVTRICPLTPNPEITKGTFKLHKIGGSHSGESSDYPLDFTHHVVLQVDECHLEKSVSSILGRTELGYDVEWWQKIQANKSKKNGYLEPGMGQTGYSPIQETENSEIP
jgi:hypothetical protein